MGLKEQLSRLWGHVEAEATRHQLADMLGKATNIVGDKFEARVKGDPFDAGQSYFGIRLAGLHLVNAREFATEQLPLCVCLAEFDYAGQRRSIPFAIGPDVLRSQLKAAGIGVEARAAWVELKDITVVRPTPVTGGEVSLFAGLFSVPGDDMVKQLLNVVGSVGSALAQPAIGAGLKVADAIYDSFSSLLSFNRVRQVSAGLIGQVLKPSGSGYLVIANASPEDFNLDEARVVQGRLCWPLDGPRQGAAVSEFDFALLAIEHYDTLLQKDSTAPVLFQDLWLAALKGGTPDQARVGLSKLLDAVMTSPDVTEMDRLALLTGYTSAFDRVVKARWPLGDEKSRGASAGTLSGRLTIAAVAAEAAADSEAPATRGAGKRGPALDVVLSGIASAAAERQGPVLTKDEEPMVGLEAAQAVRAAMFAVMGNDPTHQAELSRLVRQAVQVQ